jgi:hypothetical protein
MSSNFDITTDIARLVPHFGSEDGDSSASTNKIRNFAVALRTGTIWSLYGAGVQAGASDLKVFYKDLTQDLATDLDDAIWASATNGEQGTGGDYDEELFVYYKRTGLIYSARGGSQIMAFSPTGSAFADSSRALTYTNIGQGLVHSKDDILYIPYDNNIASNNNGSWNNTALVLPEGSIVTAISEYGNFLAIATSPLGGVGNSYVYLWDRDSTLTATSEKIDWGEGIIEVLQELEGNLIGISRSGGIAGQGGLPLAAITETENIYFKIYAGGSGAVKFQELCTDGNAFIPRWQYHKFDERLYFMMNIKLNGEQRTGVWSIGRNNPTQPFSVNHERTPINDTAIHTDGENIYGFFKVGDFLFQTYKESGGDFAMSKTKDDSEYGATAIYETTKNPGMPAADKTKDKQLEAIQLTYDPLPTAGQVVLKYRTDSTSDWSTDGVTVLTETTDNAITTEVFADATPSQFTSGREFEFRIESTGGAVVHELKYKYRVLPTLL